MRALALVLAVAACGESKKGQEQPGVASSAPAVAVPEIAPKLPGTIYFVVSEPGHAHGGTLARIAGGKRESFAEQLYPSRWSVGGKLVAIASRGDGSAGSEQLVLWKPGAVERIGPAAAQVREPAVDPAGKWIVIEAKIDPHSDLYRIDLATGESTRITNHKEGNFAPAALDASTIVFASSRDGDSEIYRMPVAGGQAQRLTAFHRDDWRPTPSPDGKTIAFLSDREGRPRVFLMSPDGTKQRRLTRRAEPDRDESDPVWSPDGTSIAYVVEHGAKWTLWLHELATGEERVLTPPGASDADPAFSPDGAYVAVARTIERNVELYAIPLAGGDPVQLTSHADLERLPRWH